MTVDEAKRRTAQILKISPVELERILRIYFDQCAEVMEERHEQALEIIRRREKEEYGL